MTCLGSDWLMVEFWFCFVAVLMAFVGFDLSMAFENLIYYQNLHSDFFDIHCHFGQNTCYWPCWMASPCYSHFLLTCHWFWRHHFDDYYRHSFWHCYYFRQRSPSYNPLFCRQRSLFYSHVYIRACILGHPNILF